MRIIRIAPAADNCSCAVGDSQPKQYTAACHRNDHADSHIHTAAKECARVDREF